MAHWYTVDPHLVHENVIEFCERSFANSEQMDQVLLTNLRDRVDREDDPWIVGDFELAKLSECRCGRLGFNAVPF